MIEGVDNYAKDVTRSIMHVPNDAVAECSSLQNQYGADSDTRRADDSNPPTINAD